MNDYNIKILFEFVKIEEKIIKLSDKYNLDKESIDTILQDISNLKEDIKKL